MGRHHDSDKSAHSHHHHHHHHHHHDHVSHGNPDPGHSHELPFRQKLEKILDHWLKHNSDHAETYQEWAAKAKAHGMGDIGGLLDEACRMTLAMNEKFEAARSMLDR